MVRNPDLRTRSICLHKDIVAKADEIVDKRLLPGINNRSGLIEYALRRVFAEVFKEQSGAS